MPGGEWVNIVVSLDNQGSLECCDTFRAFPKDNSKLPVQYCKLGPVRHSMRS